LARALVREPDVFLLDEPLSNLDAKLRTSARDELQQFQRRIGTTTLYVTHDQVEAMGLGDRIAVMNAGKVHQIGAPQEVYNEPSDMFVAAFLGSPPMNLIEMETAIVGFRPEHFLPRDIHTIAARLIPFQFCLTRIEYLGADRLLYGILKTSLATNHKVIANLPATVTMTLHPGECYQFAVPEPDLKFFDRTTGLRIPPPVGSIVQLER
jgi:multiple sugar transport system ATP-binding protein